MRPADLDRRWSGDLESQRRVIDSLRGWISGITVDRQLNATELQSLRAWMLANDRIRLPPFGDVGALLDEVLADGIVDATEHEMLLAFFDGMAGGERSVESYRATAIRELHGILQGIASDGVILAEEARGVQAWLRNYSHLRHDYPYSELTSLLDRAMADGEIDDAERREILKFCARFREEVVQDPKLHDEFHDSWFQSSLPHLKTIEDICDDVDVEFPGRSFCFTGKAEFGKRKALHALVESRGGIAKESVVVSLDYLVVGALTNPVWLYATYGSKIEKIFQRRLQGGSGTRLIHERRFVAALGLTAP